MALSDELISQFVKVTNDKTEVKVESIVYGTIVEHDGSMYVKLDGSDLLTPISQTTDISENDRVAVMIKDHAATVTGNITSPSAKNSTVQEIGTRITEAETLIADKVSTTQLDAQIGRIDNLTSDNAAINNTLTAYNGRFVNLETDNATINGKLTADEADIDDLQATTLKVSVAQATYATIDSLTTTNANVHNLEVDYATISNVVAEKANISDLNATNAQINNLGVTYANIDFANIGSAAIDNFLSKSGMIADLVVGDTTVTGKLVGVTITGDLIEGGTVKADKLVVLGEDGLYYKLNVNSLGQATASSDVKYQNGLDGSAILANSVTAEKINVDDLVAFNATIGGFNLTSSSLYSGVKSGIDNTSQGIFFGDDGQVAIGDSTNFFKFYKDGDVFKLAISADNIIFSSTGQNVEESLDNLSQNVSNSSAESIQASNLYTRTMLNSYVGSDEYNSYKNEVSSKFLQTAEDATIKFNTVTSVNSDFQSKFTEIEKYIRFSDDGIEIGSDENSLKLTIDNDYIQFTKNGQPVGWWDGTDFHTGNIVVEVNERAQFGNFAFIPRSDGSLMFLKVSGEEV